jgi:hypothetical protein
LLCIDLQLYHYLFIIRAAAEFSSVRMGGFQGSCVRELDSRGLRSRRLLFLLRRDEAALQQGVLSFTQAITEATHCLDRVGATAGVAELAAQRTHKWAHKLAGLVGVAGLQAMGDLHQRGCW